MQSTEIADGLRKLAEDKNYPKEARELFEAAATNAAAILHEHEGNVIEGKSWPEQISYLVKALRESTHGVST